MSNETIVEKVLAHCEEQKQVLENANQKIKINILNCCNAEELVQFQADQMQNLGSIMAYLDIKALILQEQVDANKEHNKMQRETIKDLRIEIDGAKKIYNNMLLQHNVLNILLNN